MSPVLLSPSCAPVSARGRLRDLALSRPMSVSEQLRQLAVQLASLASLEDVVTHGLSRGARSACLALAAPLAAPNQLRGSILVPLV